jgi:hypothetical protein
VSASEKLAALRDAVEAGGDFDSRPCDTAQNDAGWALTEALPQIVAVVEAAENSGKLAGSPLEAALAALDEALS